jgi:hypothetical protein
MLMQIVMGLYKWFLGVQVACGHGKGTCTGVQKISREYRHFNVRTCKTSSLDSVRPVQLRPGTTIFLDGQHKSATDELHIHTHTPSQVVNIPKCHPKTLSSIGCLPACACKRTSVVFGIIVYKFRGLSCYYICTKFSVAFHEVSLDMYNTS